MAGARSNTVTYVFEGDTLNLEQAVKRVQSLMRGTVKTLKEQEGGMTEVQKAQYKQLRSLMKTIKELSVKGSSITQEEQKKLNNAMKRALSLSNNLYKAKLREKDKIRRKEYAKELSEKRKTEQDMFAMEEARTPEAQVRAHSQIKQLERLKGFMDTSDPQESEALAGLNAVIDKYHEAEAAFNNGEGTMTELARATVNLNNKYKELSSSLNRLASEQSKLDHGEGKSTFLQYFFGKAKSLAVYKLIKAILAKVAQAMQKSFAKMANISKPFNDAMSRMLSSFQLIADKIATMVAPLIQLITPFVEYLAQAVGVITDKVNQMFNAIAGNDAWVQAMYQVEDYNEAVNKINQPEGIDELNKLNKQKNNMVEVKLEGMDGLKSVGEVIQNILNMVKSLIDPLVNTLAPVLGQIGELIGAIFVALNPLFTLVSNIIGVLSEAIGGALSFLIKNILGPIVNFLVTMISHLELLIPLVVSFLTLWAVFNWSKVINSLKLMITGFKELFISIWNAIKASISWVIQSIKTVAQNIKTAVSAWIAEKAYWKLALAVIAAAGVAAAVVAGIVIASTASAAAATSKYKGSDPSVGAKLATGGIVAAPTLALVGEGKYPEAVVPLGQSPQFQSMKEGIASEVINLLGTRSPGNNSSNRPIVLQLNGKELARAILPDLQYALPQTGVKLR